MTSQDDDWFSGLLLRHRGRSGLTQRVLAKRAGVSLRTVQDWEGGINYPSAEHLQALIAVLLDAGSLTPGSELAEAMALWDAALRGAPRMRTPFDRAWFADQLARRAKKPEPDVGSRETAPAAAAGLLAGAPPRRQDWGDAPDTGGFVGRVRELAQVEQWVVDDRCRVVALLGLGGMGKTTFAARLAEHVALDFDLVYWRSLRNAPSVNEWLGHAIGFLSDQHLIPPEGDSVRHGLLLNLLRERRCLLVLDNLETVLVPDEDASGLRQDYAGFRRLVQVLAESSHRSCVLVTSREAPAELAQLSGETGPVRLMALDGLSIDEGRALLGERELWGDDTAWASFVATYAGNGLALKVASATIHQVFGGDIAAFIAYVKETYGTAVRGIRRLMDGQVERRLSQLELGVLRWLAIEREPATFAELVVDLGPPVGRGAILEAVESLRRRSLVERAETAGAAAFTLQSVVLEYVTDRLVEQAADEIASGQPGVLVAHPLVKAQSKDYVRRSQERLIAQPLLERLTAANGTAGAEKRLMALLDGWRNRPHSEQGYAPGNVVNLLRLLRGDLRGLDLSRLALRQAYLAGVEAQGASLEGAHLADAVLAEAFDFPGSVALGADGTLLAAGTSTGRVWLWRVADRTLAAMLEGHTGPVWGVALAPDGRLLVSGGGDGTVRLWETSTGKPLATLRGHTGAVWAVALAADGRLLASGGEDGTVRLWETSTGQPLATMQGHTGAVRAVALAADGQLVASGGQDRMVRLWQASTGRSLAILRGHTGGLWGVALSADGQQVASGGQDGTVQLWQASTGRALAVLQGHTGGVWSVALCADGQMVASGGGDGSVRLWETGTGQPLATLQGHTGAVWAAAFSADGRLLASGGGDGSVRLWEAPFAGVVRGDAGTEPTPDSGPTPARSPSVAGGWRPLATLQGHTSGVRAVALAADGQLVASGGQDGAVRLWQASTGRAVATLQGHTGGLWGVALSADGELVTSGGADGTVRLWHAGSGQLLVTLPGHTGGVWSLALSADGRLVASGSGDGTVRLWAAPFAGGGAADRWAGRRADLEHSPAEWRPQATLQGHTSAVAGVALSADGQLVASGGADGTVLLWETSTGQQLASLPGHTSAVWGMAVCADGQLMASGSEDGTVRLWDLPTGRALATLHAHTSGVYGVALSADGQLLASGGADGTVRLWSLAAAQGGEQTILGMTRASTGRQLASLRGHTGVVRGVALSADGHLVASGGFDETVRLWEASSGTCLAVLRSARRYERVDITGVTGITDAQRQALIALGAADRSGGAAAPSVRVGDATASGVPERARPTAD